MLENGFYIARRIGSEKKRIYIICERSENVKKVPVILICIISLIIGALPSSASVVLDDFDGDWVLRSMSRNGSTYRDADVDVSLHIKDAFVAMTTKGDTWSRKTAKCEFIDETLIGLLDMKPIKLQYSAKSDTLTYTLYIDDKNYVQYLYERKPIKAETTMQSTKQTNSPNIQTRSKKLNANTTRQNEPGSNIIYFWGLVFIIAIICLFLVLWSASNGATAAKKDTQECSTKKEKSYRVVYADQMSGIEFEQYCSIILKKNYGFKSVSYTKKTGDFGGDLIGVHQDGSRWVIQCKRYSKHVGIEAVQEVIGASYIYKTEKMAVMTNNTLTASAKQLAVNSGVIVIENIRGGLKYDK